MSAWKLIVRELYERGPITTAQVQSTQPGVFAAVDRATRLGLVAKSSERVNATLSLTAAGLEYATGRATVAPTLVPKPPGWSGRMPGTVERVVPTWIAALPPPNAVRLDPRPAHHITPEETT